MEKSKIVKYKGNEYVVGLTWKEINGEKPSVIRGTIRDTINRQKYDGFGTKIEAKKTKVQVGFSNKKAKGIASLAKIFALQSEFRDSIVIVKIEEDLFWTVGITDEGFIVAGQDSLYSTNDFIDTIGAELQLGDDLKIFIAEDCLDEVSELLIESIEDLEVKAFDIDVTLGGNHKDKEIDLVYNKNIDTLMNIGMIAAFGVSATLGYSFIYKEDPLYEQIVNQDVSAAFYSKYGKFKKEMKKSRKRNAAVNESNIEVLAKTEILQERNVTYTKEEIVQNIEKLFNLFSVYLVEWQLDSIKYQNVGGEYFTIRYSRIDDSYGYKAQIEQEVVKILQKAGIPESRYSLGYGSTSGDVLLVNIQFKEPKQFNLGQGELNKEEFETKKLEFAKELDTINKAIGNVENDTLELGFFDKRFGDKLEDNESLILSKVKKGKKIFKEIKEMEDAFSNQDIDFDDSLIGGSRANMLSMMQQYSYYSWSGGQKSRPFPKANARSKKEVVSFARSYDFGVTPGNNMDVLGLKGLNDIVLNDKLLNKKHVKLKEVTFSLSNEFWEIKGETYEKI